MRWYAEKKILLYNATIISSRSDAYTLRVKGKLSKYAMPVPGGRIVDFERKPNEHGIEMRYPLYKVNVKLKEPPHA